MVEFSSQRRQTGKLELFFLDRLLLHMQHQNEKVLSAVRSSVM